MNRSPADTVECPIEHAVNIVGGRWKTMIVFRLLDGPIAYGQLRRMLTGCSERVFVRQVRELERDGVVVRDALGGNPPRVDYRLTPIGLQLRPMFNAMYEWGTLQQRVSPAPDHSRFAHAASESDAIMGAVD